MPAMAKLEGPSGWCEFRFACGNPYGWTEAGAERPDRETVIGNHLIRGQGKRPKAFSSHRMSFRVRRPTSLERAEVRILNSALWQSILPEMAGMSWSCSILTRIVPGRFIQRDCAHRRLRAPSKRLLREVDLAGRHFFVIAARSAGKGGGLNSRRSTNSSMTTCGFCLLDDRCVEGNVPDDHRSREMFGKQSGHRAEEGVAENNSTRKPLAFAFGSPWNRLLDLSSILCLHAGIDPPGFAGRLSAQS